MPNTLSGNARILLLGLEDELAAELSAALEACRCVVSRDTLECGPDRAFTLRSTFDAVFCPSEWTVFRRVLDTVKQMRVPVPLIAVSRHPEVGEWLNAMEAGAADYCGAPFETRSVRWILETNLRRAA